MSDFYIALSIALTGNQSSSNKTRVYVKIDNVNYVFTTGCTLRNVHWLLMASLHKNFVRRTMKYVLTGMQHEFLLQQYG